ncbi:MAG: hypothetical protein ABI981_11260 [Betaproteobacteria bacterium]
MHVSRKQSLDHLGYVERHFWSLALVQSDSVRPLTAGLQSLRGMWQTSWQLLSADSILAALPPMAVFFIIQRQPRRD